MNRPPTSTRPPGLSVRVFRATGRRVPLAAGDVAREFVLVVGLFLAYQAVRWIALDDVRTAFANAHMIVAWERDAGVYLERPIQAWIIESDPLARFLTTYYVWGLYPFMIFLAALTFLANRDLYRWARNAIFISWGIALIGYLRFPVAPPRFLVDQGFRDMVYGGAQDYGLPWVNQYAAMPSMHEGFAVIFGVTLYRLLAPWLGWPLAVGLPVLMFVSIVATANHFIADAFAGTVVVIIGMLLASGIERRGGQSAGARREEDSGAAPPTGGARSQIAGEHLSRVPHRSGSSSRVAG